jgi:hypothetical protein
MLLLNLKYETAYIDENNNNEMQGPKHVRELLDNIGHTLNSFLCSKNSLTCTL